MLIGLAALLALGGCASPEPTSAPQAPTATSAPQQATEPQTVTEPEVASSSSSTAAMPEVAPSPTPQVVVTPRGDELEATDPTTVSLGAGQPVLLEFFAFW